MKVIFDNNKELEFEFVESPVTDFFIKSYRHLQHIPIPFKDWDLPGVPEEQDIKENLCTAGESVGVAVDKDKLSDQNYLNYLHKIYEKNYKQGDEWLVFHEHIHLAEKTNSKNSGASKYYHIDWREKSGPLVKKFNYEWKKYFTLDIKKGSLFFQWSELAKTPYAYWEDQEPNDINRLNELAKPALTVRPKILLAVQDIDGKSDKNLDKFNDWWSRYHDSWCQHWNISEWTINDIFGMIVYGKTNDLDLLDELVRSRACPTKIKI